MENGDLYLILTLKALRKILTQTLGFGFCTLDHAFSYDE
jgi:hypothetical protein